MSKVDGLIIPRSYNDYYSKSDNAAMREVIAQNTDSSLSSVSEMPVQNKVVKSALDAAVPVDSVADGEMKPPTSNAVYDAISAEHEGNAPIMASTTTISGPALATNGSVLIMFTDNIAGSDGTTPLALTYNGTSIPVKAHSGGSLVDVTAKEIAASTYRYLDKYTSFQMVFDGTNFVIVGNPVVLSSSNYTIYADGSKIVDTVADGNMNPVTSNAVYDEVNKIRNTQIVVGTSRTVNVHGTMAERWSAYLLLPTIPDGKKVLRWFAVVLSQSTNTNGCAIVGYTGSSGIPTSIITVQDNDGTMEIAYAAEIF